MRSAAEGEHRTGEDVGKAAPLTALEAIQPIGKGQVKGTRPPHLLPQPVGQEPTRDATRRGLPKRSAEGSSLVTDWRDRGRSVVAKRFQSTPAVEAGDKITRRSGLMNG